MILLTLVGMTLAALLKMYFEAYNSYTAACVLGVSNSTFLIRNMNSLAFNYASMEGNGVLSNGLANYNSRSASACTSHYAPSVQEYNTYWEQVSKLNSTYYESTNPQYDKVQLVAKCMSKASLQHVDQYLQGQCCDVSSQEPNTLSTAAGSSISADKHQMWGGSLWPGYKQCNGTLANERFCPVYNSSLERAEATAATTLIMINRFINDSNLLPIPPPSWAMHSPACQYKQWALRSAQLWNFTSQAQQPDQSDRVTKSWRQTEMAMQTSNSTIDRSNDLENPSFRCEALPTCEVTCGGPDAALISAMSQSCSCVIEWYAHSHVLRGLFVLIIYIVLNISRICITKAVLRVFWRALHVPIFEVFLNCDEHGTMLDQSGKPIIPEDLAAEGSNSHTLVSKGCSGENTENATQTLSSDSDALAANQPPSSAATGTQAQIAALIKREVDFHVKSGMYLMLFGIAINAIWIYLLQQVETAVVYRPHHQEIVY